MKNIKILGAGLSGLSAAINLTKAGYDVDVFEKRNDCGMRFHGDLEGLENWSSTVDVIEEFKSMNIKINFDCDPFKKFYLSDGKELLNNTFNTPAFYLVKRGTNTNCFDQGLKKQALDLGVNIHFNSKTNEENMDIISYGCSELKPVGIVKGIGFETESDDIAVVLLNKEASNKGYSYLLISNGWGSMCSVNLYRTDDTINRYYKKTYEIFTKLFDIDIKNEKNVGGVGSFLAKPRLVKKGKLYTGEAAGLQDLLWGFGMRYAINSGYLAALSIIENKNYKELIKQMLLGRIKTSISNRFFADWFEGHYYNDLIRWAKVDNRWLKILHWAYNPQLITRGIYPIAKWYLQIKYARR